MISLDKDENEIENHNEENSLVEEETRQLSASAVKSLSDIAKWGKISGILLIIMGSLVTLTALMTVIGAIPGRTAHYFRRIFDALSKSSRGSRRKSSRQRWRKHA